MNVKLDTKKDFPMFSRLINGRPLIYLDTAATAHKPASVVEAVSDFYGKYYGTVFRTTYALSQEASFKYCAVRDKIRNFLNAERSEEIVFMRGSTHAINILARSAVEELVPEGGCILLSDIEHHANVISWQLAVKYRNIKIKQIMTDSEGFLLKDHLESLLKQGADFVSIPHISNVYGSIQPLKEIAELVHKYGAFLCIDGAQGAPHVPVDVRDTNVDFYIFSGHKLYGPTGIGVLYGKYELLDRLPPIEGGGDMVEVYDPENIIFAKPPMKFEAGTPSIASVHGLGAAIDYVTSFGMDAIFAWERILVKKALDLLSDFEGLHILGTLSPDRRGSLISFSIENLHPFDVGLFLNNYGIALRTGNHCSQPAMLRAGLSHVSRISFGIYNTEEDLDFFAQCLREIVLSLKT
ncbi:MAG: SufS family cysteine desulfurase [Victivallaceae bacterium]